MHQNRASLSIFKGDEISQGISAAGIIFAHFHHINHRRSLAVLDRRDKSRILGLKQSCGDTGSGNNRRQQLQRFAGFRWVGFSKLFGDGWHLLRACLHYLERSQRANCRRKRLTFSLPSLCPFKPTTLSFLT